MCRYFRGDVVSLINMVAARLEYGLEQTTVHQGLSVLFREMHPAQYSADVCNALRVEQESGGGDEPQEA